MSRVYSLHAICLHCGMMNHDIPYTPTPHFTFECVYCASLVEVAEVIEVNVDESERIRLDTSADTETRQNGSR